MIGEQRNYIAAIAEHVFGESLQGLLRPNLDKHAGARVVESGQALYELHRRRDLL